MTCSTSARSRVWPKSPSPLRRSSRLPNSTVAASVTLPLMPVTKFMVERARGARGARQQGGGAFGRYAQSFALALPEGITADQLARTFTALVDRHDALRSTLALVDGEWKWEIGPAGSVDVSELIDHVEVAADADLDAVAKAAADKALAKLDTANGVVRLAWLDRGAAAGRLLVFIHHMAVDGVSWRIIVPDLFAAWTAVSAGQKPELGAVGTSVRRWSHGLVEAAVSDEIVG